MMSRVILLSLSASLIFAAPATASEENLKMIDSLCSSVLNLSPEGCACVREKASELTDDQQAYAIAAAKRDDAARTAINLTDDQKKQVQKFIVQVPKVCKNPS